MKTTITTITLALALAACTGDDTGTGDDATTITTTPDESSSDDAGSSSDGSSSAGDELDDDSSSSDDGSSSSDSSSETTGAGVCEPVTYVNADGMAFTCCCDGGPEEAACPDDLPLCACDSPTTLPEHSACGSGCDAQCAIGLSCRENYAGGALAECAAPCGEDGDCDTVGDVCSAGWCVTPCGPEGECAEGSYCYPGTELDGTPIVDPAHPVPHCMPTVAA